MSGGHFEYEEYKLSEIQEAIQTLVDRNGQPYSDEDQEWEGRILPTHRTDP